MAAVFSVSLSATSACVSADSELAVEVGASTAVSDVEAGVETVAIVAVGAVGAVVSNEDVTTVLVVLSSTTDGVVLLGCVSVTGAVATSECATEDSTASEVVTLVAVSLATVRDAVLVSGIVVAVATVGAVSVT